MTAFSFGISSMTRFSMASQRSAIASQKLIGVHEKEIQASGGPRGRMACCGAVRKILV